MFARIFMFVLFRLYMYDMDNVYVCIVLTKWSNKNKFFFFFFFFFFFLKRVNGDTTRAVCSLRIDVSEALYAIPCDKRRSFAYSLDLLCSVIRFVGRTMCVASSTSMIIWCDHWLLVALWFRFHIELATCLLFGFRSSYLRPTCERHRPTENETRE